MTVAEPGSERSTVHWSKMKSSGLLSCVGACSHTTSREELIFISYHLETITIITDVCVCIGGRRGLMRAVSGAPPGASY